MKVKLILKARAGLVQKKVQVTRGGKTFTQTIWIRAEEKKRDVKENRALLEKQVKKLLDRAVKTGVVTKKPADLSKFDSRELKSFVKKMGKWNEYEDMLIKEQAKIERIDKRVQKPDKTRKAPKREEKKEPSKFDKELKKKIEEGEEDEAMDMIYEKVKKMSTAKLKKLLIEADFADYTEVEINKLSRDELITEMDANDMFSADVSSPKEVHALIKKVDK